MRIAVVDIVEIEGGLERSLGRPCKEVQAAVEGQDVVGLLYHGRNRGEAEDIVVARSAGEFHQKGHRVFDAGVDVPEVYSAGGGKFHRIERRCPVQTALVDVCHHQQGGLSVFPVQHVIDSGQSHRPDGGQKGHFSAVLDLHRMNVFAGGSVIIGMHGSDHTGEGLAQGSRIKAFSLIGKQAAAFHHLIGNDDISGISADMLV